MVARLVSRLLIVSEVSMLSGDSMACFCVCIYDAEACASAAECYVAQLACMAVRETRGKDAA